MRRILGFVLLLFVAPCFAGEPAGVERLGEVVVTATTTKVPVKRLPVNVRVITRREIEQSNADNLGDLLAEKLAGHIHKYPGLLTSVGIRGFRTDPHGTDVKGRVLVLIDGHRAGTGNLAEIPLDNVERIEIVRGPASVVYGSAAMGGVINVITKRGRGRPSFFAGLRVGSWDYSRSYAGGQGRLGRFNFSFSASREHRNDYEDGDGHEIDNTDYHDFKGGFRLGFEPAEGHELSLVGQFSEFWRVGSPGPTYSPDPDNYKDVRRKYISLAYDASWSELFSSHVSYYYVQDSNEWHDPSASWGYRCTKTLTNTQGVRVRGVFSPKKAIRLTAGFDWDGIKVKNVKYPRGSGSPYMPNSSYDDYAGYLQAELTLGRLYLLAGARYDYWEEELRPTQRMTLKTTNEDYDHITWRAGASYALFDWLKVRAAVGTAYRTPTADELSGRFERSYSKIVGNPHLDPETSTTYEVGLDVSRGSLRAGLDYFHTEYDDRISGGFATCVDGDCTWTTYKNVDGATLEGIEFYASYDLGEPLELPFVVRPYVNGVFYLKREIDDGDYRRKLGDDTVPYISKWNLTGGLEAGLPDKFTANLSFFYVGRQKVQEWNWRSPDYGKVVDKGGFTVFNVKITWRPCRYAELYLGVENIFDKDYSFVNYYPMPGRSFNAGVVVRF